MKVDASFVSNERKVRLSKARWQMKTIRHTIIILLCEPPITLIFFPSSSLSSRTVSQLTDLCERARSCPGPEFNHKAWHKRDVNRVLLLAHIHCKLLFNIH